MLLNYHYPRLHTHLQPIHNITSFTA